MKRLLVEIIDIKSNFDKGSKGRDGDSEEHFKHLREFLYCEHTVGRNMNMKGVFGKTSDGNEEHVIGQWRQVTLAINWQRTCLNCVSSLQRTCRRTRACVQRTDK